MTPLAVLRHGPTEWNRVGRMQGRRDMPLADDAAAELAQRVLPPRFADWDVVSSPLVRAAETASLITSRVVPIDPRLIETDWGQWEGRTHAELEAQFGAEFTAAASRGLDFQPPGGESPRMVQARLKRWLAERAALGRPTVAVVHKGIITALLSLATGWPLLGRPPIKLDWACLHVFGLAGDGTLELVEPNVPLATR